MIGNTGSTRIFLCTQDTDMRKSFGTPGEAWRLQRVKFPSRQEEEPPHRESSLGLMEVTT